MANKGVMRGASIGGPLGQISSAVGIHLVRMAREEALAKILTGEEGLPQRALAMKLSQVYGELNPEDILSAQWLEEFRQLAFPEEELAMWEQEIDELHSDDNPNWKNLGSRVIKGQVLCRRVCENVDEAKRETLRVEVTLESFHHEGGNVTHKKPVVSVIGRSPGSTEPKDEELPVCPLCGRPVEPTNDDGLLMALVFGQGTTEHKHLLPVMEGETMICAGMPSSAQYLEGQAKTDRYFEAHEEMFREAYRQLLLRYKK